SGSCTPLRRPSRLRAVAEAAPQCRPPSCLGERSGSGSESWPNGGLSWPYLRLSRPPTRSDAPVQPASGWSAWATSGADRAKQRCFSPAATELRQTLKSAPRGICRSAPRRDRYPRVPRWPRWAFCLDRGTHDLRIPGLAGPGEPPAPTHSQHECHAPQAEEDERQEAARIGAGHVLEHAERRREEEAPEAARGTDQASDDADLPPEA